MTDFPNHDRHSAPPAALPSFDAAERNFGMIPNLARKMATAPALLEAYLQVGALFDTTSLTPQERQVVLLTVSRENSCGYCMGAHSVLADMSKVPEAVTAAIREDGAIPDPRLAALNRFTRVLVQQRGWVPEEALQAFLDAGFDRHHAGSRRLVSSDQRIRAQRTPRRGIARAVQSTRRGGPSARARALEATRARPRAQPTAGSGDASGARAQGDRTSGRVVSDFARRGVKMGPGGHIDV